MVEPGALETCHTEQPSEASKLVRTRAQRIPSRSRASAHKKTGYICADQPVHLHFSLATRRRTIHSGLPTTRPRLKLWGVFSPIRIRSLRTWPLLFVLTGCDQPVHCPQIAGVTRVVIGVWSSAGIQSDVEVTDPDRIRQLVDFANTRRNCSRPTTYTMPAGRTSVTFYRGATAESAIAAGPNFFVVGCGNSSGLRQATKQELSDFAALTSPR
jgi:hypothetical protein